MLVKAVWLPSAWQGPQLTARDAHHPHQWFSTTGDSASKGHLAKSGRTSSRPQMLLNIPESTGQLPPPTKGGSSLERQRRCGGTPGSAPGCLLTEALGSRRPLRVEKRGFGRPGCERGQVLPLGLGFILCESGVSKITRFCRAVTRHLLCSVAGTG